MKKEVKYLITQLKKGKIRPCDIPFKYKGEKDIIIAERKLGLRKVFRCGYDIINDKFFVEEAINCGDNGWQHLLPLFFDEFDSYYDYLDGNIYENACYFQIDSNKLPDYVDKQKLFIKNAFINYTIDDYRFHLLRSTIDDYSEGEKRKKEFTKWLEKINQCIDAAEFEAIVSAYRESRLYSELTSCTGISWDDDKERRIKYSLIWDYVNFDVQSEQRFLIVIDYLSGYTCANSIVRQLCVIYKPEHIASYYDCWASSSLAGCKAQNTRLRNFAKATDAGMITLDSKKAFFDTLTHYYWEQSKYRIEYGKYTHNQGMGRDFCTYKLFENFDKFITYRKGDLSDTDLSNDINLSCDFSRYITNENTKLPICDERELKYMIEKGYKNGCFVVNQLWYKDAKLLKQYNHSFRYFCDFVAFLRGDLSNADLLSCEGLAHLLSTDNINLSKALVTSNISNKFGVPGKKYELPSLAETSFSFAEQNEVNTVLALGNTRELTINSEDNELLDENDDLDTTNAKIYYISDIHLYHLLQNKKAESKNDIVKVIRDLVNTIIFESQSKSIILINGDTSLDFSVFQLFVSELRTRDRTIVFTIGNHDMWSCPNLSIDQLADKYRSYLYDNGMYLLHNDILYFDELEQAPFRITEKEIESATEEELRSRTRAARLILFGGTGFAGYNQSDNAKLGLYRYNKTIGYNRDIEIKETHRFEELYKKICKPFHDKNVIIMTHMPLPDWLSPAQDEEEHDHLKNMESEQISTTDHSEDKAESFSRYQRGFVYTSGHTHKNYYYDDGEIRIYADNQFGYNNANPSAWPHLKYFEIEKTYDYFADVEDGIHEISADDYRRFYRAKNIYMDFYRDVNTIYMLKKNGYYCFIHKSKQNRLSIMNGGALKRLVYKDIRYYYKKMNHVTSTIKKPLDKYTKYQEKISEEIKKLGGNGTIHGCIIDIDFFNHIYLNPFDGTVTGYWASDIINKEIYPTIPALLKAQCPILYARYSKMLKGEIKENLPTLTGYKNSNLSMKPVPYLDTDIYRASRQMKKLQRLNSNILTTWPDKLSRQ